MTRKESNDYCENMILEMIKIDLDEDLIINEDGTLYDPPPNPLKEKWNKLYPPTPMPQYSQVCDGYSCMYCGRCPHGDLWTTPDEDVDVMNEYLAKLKEYHKIHNPFRYGVLYNHD